MPRLGAKAFEQAAGFLRIRDGEHPLDAGAVHPESYRVVDAMARDLGVGVRDLMTSAELRGRIELSRYVDERVGLPTLRDILAELAKPGRDPRGVYEPFQFAPGIEKLDDLEPGMRLPGIVTNVTAFGAFVDVGVHQDGLVHISQLADRFVRDPHAVVKVQQQVMVTVMGVDRERRRISLSLKSRPEGDSRGSREGVMIGSRRKRHRAAVKAASAGTPPNQAVMENLSGLDHAAIAVTDKVGTMGFFLIIVTWTVLWTGYNILATKATALALAPVRPVPGVRGLPSGQQRDPDHADASHHGGAEPAGPPLRGPRGSRLHGQPEGIRRHRGHPGSVVGSG